MASITSATSGPSNSGSTWTGGVVPGTTFAGSRTTTGAAVAAGATSIPVTATTPAVTAGKWLRVVQSQTHYYRVATGLASGASGNIVLDSNTPIIEAIPASATTINVDMVDDKVTIAHPGTNNASTTAYLLNGAHSAGATTINVDTGTGTILAGECVQFEHQIGTDEDGQPIYDNTYYLVSVALTAGVITIAAPGLAYAMADNVRVVNRGHVVELVANHVWGDDTSSTTAANNGIVVLGTLKASRSVSQTLVCRGTLFLQSDGSLDWGASGDGIPAAVSAAIVLNDSAALAGGKHGATSHNGRNPTWRISGATRTRNTRLTGATSAGATSITVDAATGWEDGDRVIIASDTDDASRAQLVTLGAGSGLTWPVSPAVTNARLAACRCGNLSSNVVVRSLSATNPSFLSLSSLQDTTRRIVDVTDIRVENVGNGTGGTAFSNSPNYYGFAFAMRTNVAEKATRVAVEHTSSTPSRSFGGGMGGGADRVFRDFAVYVAGSSQGLNFGDSLNLRAEDCVVYRAGDAIVTGFSAGASLGEVVGGEYWGGNTLNIGSTISMRFSGGASLHGSSTLFLNTWGSAELSDVVLSGARLLSAGVTYASAKVTISNSTISAGALSGNLTNGNVPNQTASANLIAVNNDPTDNRVLSYYQTTVTDLTTRLQSTYAVKVQPKVSNLPITYVFTLPAISGVAQLIKGSLRFDATYGTATPPSIALSGQGVSQSFTAPATADAWHDFSFSFTPTSTGDITATVTVQSTSTSGFAWLDGVWHYPMTQSVRHFGYQWLPQAAQLADTRITLSEAAALALPVAVDHGTNTITVSGPVTASEVFEACMADLAQTANQGEAVHISSATGATFSTSYTVAFSGTGAISGAYTDSAGLHVKITAASLLTGSRVQLYNVTDSTELLNTELTGAGLVHDLTYPGTDKTIRLRVAKVGYLPIQATGVLSSSGLSFLDAQVVDAVYVANGVDGSTCTEFAPDYPNLQVEVTDPDNITSVQRIYAWTRWANWIAADGIRLMHNSVQASDTANYSIDVAVVDAHFQNMNAAPLMVVGGYIRRSDGTTVISAGGSIQMDPGKAYVATGSAAITVPAGERVITRAADGAYFARS